MCACGRYEVIRSFGCMSRSSTIAEKAAIRLAWVSSTPLGGPVVPEV